MNSIDYPYICAALGNLSGIPIRCYEGDAQIFYYSTVALPRDPMTICRAEIWQITDHVGYYVTPLFHYYGIVNAGPIKLVIGPTCQVPNKNQVLRELAFRADVPRDEVGDFVQAIRSITPMPLESLLQMLCTVNYVLNGEKLQLEDIAIYDAEQGRLHTDAQKRRADRPGEKEAERAVHNTYSIEQTLMDMIRKGDSAALRQWISKAPAVRGGVLAADQLRQMRNTFIVSATLASRAAIRGGLDVEEAFSMSDAYIQRCELMTSPDKIMNLSYHMMTEFTERVEHVRHGQHSSKLANQVAAYVQRHLSEPSNTEDLAKELYLSRTHLSAKFHRETGETLAGFIAKEKTEEAKRLLRYTDKPMTAISGYLGFSSPGHFANVFKKHTGKTPKEYRERYTR